MSWRARFTPAVSTVVVWLNPKDPMCFGVRNWVRMNLPEIQLLNPQLQMTVQEITFGEPHMIVTFSPTEQRTVRLAGATEDECEDVMKSIVTYGDTHAVLNRPRADDGGEVINQPNIISFGYSESFLAKLEVSVSCDMGQTSTMGIDDPGQVPRLFPRNTGTKILP